jgi:tripartite-type tricarboxylate transporter receptor subunit TctC
MTGAARVAKAAPDGYQFVLGGTGPFAANQTLYKHPLYHAATDFVPVVLLAEEPLLLVTRKDFPAASLPEFIVYAKANQARMQYGSPGAGSTSHLACVLLNAAIGLDVTHVPYRGGAPAYQDLIAGRIDYMCPYGSTAIPQIEAGTVKAIASLSQHRLAKLPNLASVHEQGLVDFDAYQWFAIFLPKDTPAAIVRTLHDAAVATLNTPAMRKRLDQIGAVVVAPERQSPDYLQSFVESEIRKWGAAIKSAHIHLE